MATSKERDIETDSMPCTTECRYDHDTNIQNSTEDHSKCDILPARQAILTIKVARRFPRGYPELAACMNSDPGLNMFRRFSYLHLRQLLYMQEQLATLEQRLYQIDGSDTIEINPMSRRFDRNKERQETMAEIKVALLEYGQIISKCLDGI